MNKKVRDLSVNGKGDGLITPDVEKIKKAALALRIFENITCSRIFMLVQHNEKLTLKDVYTQLRIKRSTASQHLLVLQAYGYLKAVRDGKLIYYSANVNRLEQVQNAILLNLIS